MHGQSSAETVQNNYHILNLYEFARNGIRFLPFSWNRRQNITLG